MTEEQFEELSELLKSIAESLEIIQSSLESMAESLERLETIDGNVSSLASAVDEQCSRIRVSTVRDEFGD